MKFKEAARDFLSYIKVTRSNGTFRYNKSKCSVLIEYFNTTDINIINKKVLIKFIEDIKERNPDISPVTINKYIATIKRIIKYNLEKEVEFEKLPETRKVIPVLKKSTIHKLFSHFQMNLNNIEKTRNYVLFKLLYDTGLRINEALNVKISDICFDSNTILVRVTKTNNERYVFFSFSTAELIKQLITRSKNKIEDYLFISYRKNHRITVDNVMKIAARIKDSLDLEESIRPHKWRHTFATNFLNNGGNLEALRQILGHSNLTTTQIYLHIDKENLHKEYFKQYNHSRNSAKSLSITV